MTMTTIKVPMELRDRLAARAKRDHITLAAAIAKALDEAEERQFWDAVREENAHLTEDEREEYRHDSTLLDDLADPEDEAISARGGW
jgi:predicted transcriptional regulator